MLIRRLERTLVVVGGALFVSRAAPAQRPIYLAPNAPQDKPPTLTELCQWDALIKAQGPYVAQARATYPAAKRRFVAGLPSGQTFFVTVRLTDSLKRHEQVFIAVDSAAGDSLIGRISSDIAVVRGHHFGQRYVTREADIVDWLISQPDGSEDGNFVGKFIDTYQPPRECRDGSS